MVILLQITIQDIHGDKFDIEVQNDAEVLGLKLQIWEKRQISPETQRLVFAGRQLQDDENLAEVGINSGSVIFMVQQGSQVQAVAQPAPGAVAQPVVQQPPVAYAQPQPQSGFAPHVQAMNVQMPPAQQPGSGNQIVVVQQQQGPQETCCCCIPLRAGVMILIVLQILGHLWGFLSFLGQLATGHGIFAGITLFFTLIALLFDGVAIYGWTKKLATYLKAYSFFMIFQMFIKVVGGIVMFSFAMTRTYSSNPHHHHHHSNGGYNSDGYGYGYETSSTAAPRHLNGNEKLLFSAIFVAMTLVSIAIGGYYINAVYRYAKKVETEDNQRPRVNVNGVVYEQV